MTQGADQPRRPASGGAGRRSPAAASRSKPASNARAGANGRTAKNGPSAPANDAAVAAPGKDVPIEAPTEVPADDNDAEAHETPIAPTARLTSNGKPPGSQSPSAAPGRPTGLKLLLHLGRPRATRAQLLVALLCGLLGFALVTQVHSQAGSGLSSARQADLIDVLDNLSAKSEQLQSQIADAQQRLSKLTGGAGQTEAALEEAQQRAATLRILAGTVGATGPGIDLRIADPDHNVTADVLLDILEELRDAGAEAVEIRGGGAPAADVRLVASSYFVDSQDGNGVLADGTALLPPYDILAIGDPPTLSQAMGIPGGVLDTLKSKTAQGVVTRLDAVRITALHALTSPQYARPAASQSAGS